MYIQISVAIAVIASFFYYTFWIKPKKLIENYRKQFQAAGFKPYMLPFKPFQISSLLILDECEKRSDILEPFKKDFKDYDLIIGNSFNRVAFQFFSPKLIKEFCDKERDWYYEKDEKINELLLMIIGRGLVLSEGEVWKKKRKTLNQVFNFNFIASQSGAMISCCEQAFHQILNVEKKNSAQRFSVKSYAVQFTSNFIIRGFLGGNLKKEKIRDQNPAQVMKELIDNLRPLFDDLTAVILGPKFVKLGLREKDRNFMNKLNSFNDWAASYAKNRVQEQKQKIKEMGSKYEATDIISSLTLINNESESNKPYTNEDIVNELKTFFLAAIETTSSTFMSMVFNVYKNPEILAKLKEQINSKVKEEIKFEDIKSMSYLEAIQNETLRMMGPTNAIIPRKAVSDNTLAGVEIKKDVFIEYYAIPNHYNEKYFNGPLQFRPERWLNQCKNLEPYIYMPFHGGPRSCIGKHVGLLESKIALIMFVRKFREVKVLSEEWKGQIGLVFWPKDYQVEVKL